MAKCFKEIFKEVEINKEAENILINSMRVDRKKRSMHLVLRQVPEIRAYRNMRKALCTYYQLTALSVSLCIQSPLSHEFTTHYSQWIIEKLSEQKSIYRYVFKDSLWEPMSEKLIITLYYGSLELLEQWSTATLIGDIIRDELGHRVSVRFKEGQREGGAESEDYPPVVYAPSEPLPKTVKAKPVTEKSKATVAARSATLPAGVIKGKAIKGELTRIIDISDISGTIIIEGEVLKTEVRELTKIDKYLFSFHITDYTGTIICKMFLLPAHLGSVSEQVKKGMSIKVRGDVGFDRFVRDYTVMAKDIAVGKGISIRMDDSSQKRVELHLHTKMSAMDGMTSAKKLVERAITWGHKAIAITDHGCCQAFPEAFHAKGKNPIKIIYGVEAYLIDDMVNDGEATQESGNSANNSAEDATDYSIEQTMVVFDIETTGLSAVNDAITEIGAVKIANGKIIDSYSALVNPMRKIPPFITSLTGISDEMVAEQPDISIVLPEFLKFVGDVPLVAHNAAFDVGFISQNASRLGLTFDNAYIDTVTLSRRLLKNLKKHKLDIVAKELGIPNEEHHRAVNDAQVCAQIYMRFVEMMDSAKSDSVGDVSEVKREGEGFKVLPTYHAIILAKNQVGLRNLYELISISHLEYFYKRPRIPKSVYNRYREGLIIGSACEAGELYKAIKKKSDPRRIEELCEFYDYYEIQPLGNNQFMVDKGQLTQEQLVDINKEIVRLGDRYNKPVVATCDVHFMDPQDSLFREILMTGMGYTDAQKQPPLYFRTTEEMLREFSYLSEDVARKIVVDNTNLIADMVDDIRPVPEGSFPPEIEGSSRDIEAMCYRRARDIYGEQLPEVVEKRLEKELKSIINNGFAVMYMIAHKLVTKSLQDGYMVGSRGSVGSSLVAFLCDITEINALPAHYVCPKCKHSQFGGAAAGCDLPNQDCPQCGTAYKKDGHDIPFETFLGFDGDKSPDIDLNFSGDYQATAHKYTEELFGTGSVFRAGTISTLAERTAYGYVRKYLDETNKTVSNAEIDRLTMCCSGVRKTTGQHPGGIIVVPKGHSIYEFTPVQRPANDTTSDTITTHFDYHSIDENLLKLDILGHDDPTVIRMLEELTGVDASKISTDDQKTLSLFTGTEALGVTAEQINSDTGTYGVPEFGTKFVRQMLMDTQPKRFSDLVRISGLSHGTDVWLGNAQELIRSGICTLADAICTRDDIMLYLIEKGMDPKLSFTIMESVRKGKGLKPEWEEAMGENNVPDWYVDSCKKIKYMFPKAHACAYVTMAFRIAWFKVNYPTEFYVAYFSIRADDFDYEIMCRGKETAVREIERLQSLGKEISNKEKSVMTILELVVEMNARGIKFTPISLYHSHATKFLIEDGKIVPPLVALAGLGDTVAKNIAEEREKGQFQSIDQFKTRTKATKTVVEILRTNGCLDDMPESNQLTLF